MQLRPAIGKFLQEDGYVVIGIRMRIAARPRPEQDDALDPIAIYLIQGCADVRKDRIAPCSDGHIALVSQPLIARGPWTPKKADQLVNR